MLLVQGQDLVVRDGAGVREVVHAWFYDSNAKSIGQRWVTIPSGRGTSTLHSPTRTTPKTHP